MTADRIRIGPTAGHCLKPSDLTVTYHCTCGDRKGYYHCRKWLADRAAFNYDPRLGWAYDRWFTWIEDQTQ